MRFRYPYDVTVATENIDADGQNGMVLGTHVCSHVYALVYTNVYTRARTHACTHA